MTEHWQLRYRLVATVEVGETDRPGLPATERRGSGGEHATGCVCKRCVSLYGKSGRTGDRALRIGEGVNVTVVKHREPNRRYLYTSVDRVESDGTSLSLFGPSTLSASWRRQHQVAIPLRHVASITLDGDGAVP